MPFHVPILRGGADYASLVRAEVVPVRGGEPLASVSQANAGLLRRDLRHQAARARALRAVPVARLLEVCAEAAERFLEDELPVSADGPRQSPQEYVSCLSATSGLPHALVRANMDKIALVLREMPRILAGLTRGLDHSVLDESIGAAAGGAVCYRPAADALGVVLPSNSPGVNSLWLPAIALKTPVVLKPGREEPWTPLRIARALLAAGCPPEALSLYPTDHEGADAILAGCGRALLFGDEQTTARYSGDPRIELHGPGRSKVVLGADAADRWEQHLDLFVESVAANGGRSCINASSIRTPRHADAIADALARRLAEIVPRAPEDPAARLSAFANPRVAEWIDASIEAGIAAGAVDVSARHRGGPRRAAVGGAEYVLPTVVRCDLGNPLADTELLFPFASVVDVPPERLATTLGPTLVLTAITRDPKLRAELLASPDVDRLNLGAVPTTRVEWDQPHEGNLFELLWRRRAIAVGAGW